LVFLVGIGWNFTGILPTSLLCRQLLKVQKTDFFCCLACAPSKNICISLQAASQTPKNGAFAETNFRTCVAGDRYADLLPGTENTVESVYIGMAPFSFAKAKFEMWAVLGRWLSVLCPRMYLRRNAVQFLEV
jgi:hypothetical protein